MPSPIAHAMGGVAAAWTIDLLPGNRAWRATPTTERGWWAGMGGGLTALCAALAIAPDLDYLTGAHRTATHSVTAVVIVGIVSAVVAAMCAKPALRVGLMCAAAYGTHPVLDLVTIDHITKGIQLFWPFSPRRFIAGWNIFPLIESHDVLSALTLARNARVGAEEIAIMTPVLMVLWFARKKNLPS